MDAAADLDEELVAKSLAELADRDYQDQVWAGRVPAVRSSLVACYAALFGESGLSDALDDGLVFTDAVDSELLRLRLLLETIDDRQSIAALLRDPRLDEVRSLAGAILRQLGVTHVTKRGLPELDLPLELPRWSRAARIGAAAVVLVVVVAALVIVFRPTQRCAARDTGGVVSAYSCH